MLSTALVSAIIIPLISLTSSITASDQPQPVVIAEQKMSLENRHPVPAANQVYKDNILLALAYQRGSQKFGQPIDWAQVRAPFSFSQQLEAGQTYSFHDGVLDKYANQVARTSNAHFSGDEGFKSDGYLMGNGVCHLASLINWVSRDAGLDVVAPTNHNFAAIPEIDPKYGTAIYAQKDSGVTYGNQNLYVTNNHGETVEFVYEFDGQNLTIKVVENI